MDLQSDHLELLIKRFQQQRPLRTGSLIITLFGECQRAQHPLPVRTLD